VRAFAVPVCCLVALVSGCGKTVAPDEPVDPAKAKEVLTAALDAWKGGAAYGALESRSPPVVFAEPLWEGGATLNSYELGTVELTGRQGRCTVKLSLTTKDGKPMERRVGYLIDTAPRAVIVREGMGP
jgi:hypothetical protein